MQAAVFHHNSGAVTSLWQRVKRKMLNPLWYFVMTSPGRDLSLPRVLLSQSSGTKIKATRKTLTMWRDDFDVFDQNWISFWIGKWAEVTSLYSISMVFSKSPHRVFLFWKLIWNYDTHQHNKTQFKTWVFIYLCRVIYSLTLALFD